MFLLLQLFAAGILFVSAEWTEDMENKGLFEGDIVLDPDEMEETFKKWKNNGNAYASIKGGRWPKATIYYQIESSIAPKGRAAIAAAIEDYHKETCLRFIKRTNQRSYISFYRGGGCSSPVGWRYGRMNRISLASGCWYKGIVMHEIGHSIGLFHEQSRPDRDQYVKILWNNIQSNMRFNFNLKSKSTIDSLGTEYDYLSMMHYGSTAFGRGRRTIETIKPEFQRKIGSRRGFSEIDKVQINRMYCGGKVPTTLHPDTTTGGPGGGTTEPTPPSECKDIDGRCKFWSSVGYCAESNAVEQQFVEIMKRKCCKSCKENAKCSDRNSRCHEWASRNPSECTKNPKYMNHNCRKSCKRCS